MNRLVLSVAQALAHPGGRLAVAGYLLAHPDGTIRLCTGLAGSYPPQCGRPALRVEGLTAADVGRLPGAVHASGVAWTGEVTLDGTVCGTVLTVIA